jgi:phosphoglycolate phosphatase
MRAKPDLIVFDLDGTLVDSAPDLVASVNFALTQLGRAPHSQETIQQWIGNGADVLIKRALVGDWHIESQPMQFEEAFEHFKSYYATHFWVHSRLYAGVLETLQDLTHKGVLLACVTNKTAQFTKPILEMAGIASYFKRVASGDTFEVMKPDPLPLLEVAKQIGIAPEKAWMVGDSVNDIMAGKRAGFKTVAVSYGYAGHHSMTDLNADFTIDAMHQLIHLVTHEL